MANLVFWSDLHTEFRAFDLPDLSEFPAEPDAVLLAGDTATMGQNIDEAARICDAYGVPVILIDGNHEYYRLHMGDYHAHCDRRVAELAASGRDIRILRGTATEVAGTRIIGATLWTDFALMPAWRDLAITKAERNMMDYRMIRLDQPHRQLRPADTAALHAADKAAILSLLDEPFEGPTVVMTHHLPLAEVVHAKFQGDILTPAFASNLASEILDLPFEAWIFGHSHLAREVETGGAFPHRFVSNQRGYPGEPTQFDPLRMLITGKDKVI